MKIIAIIPSGNYHDPKYLCEVSNEEMELLRSGNSYGRNNIAVGERVELCQRFRKLEKLEEHLANAESTPGTLRSLADAMEFSLQAALKAVTSPEAVK